MAESRAGVAQPFVRRITKAMMLQEPGVTSLAVTMRCRTAPPSYAAPTDLQNVALERWIAERTFYPVLTRDPATVRDRLAKLEAKLGRDDLKLLPLLKASLSLPMPGEDPAAASERTTAILERTVRILEANGADPAQVAPLRIWAEMGRAFAAGGLAGTEQMATALRRAIDRPKVTPAELDFIMTGIVDNDAIFSEDLRLSLLERIAGRIDAAGAAADPVLVRRVARARMDLLRALDRRGETAAIGRAAGLAPDLCEMAEVAPRVGYDIAPDDYPRALRSADVTGITVLEVAVDAKGALSDHRVVLSYPPGLFDTVMLAKAKTFAAEPAQRGGKPIACRGNTASIVWNLQDRE